ncbi:MAG: carboxypeptidase-like regulatory domain-containing protein [Terriglobales bacterium]
MSLPLRAQTASSGTIIGVITDPSGAAVPGAPVTLLDQATQQMRATISNGSGRYSFVGVAPGTYTVTAQARGFQKSQQANLAVEVGKSYAINMRLAIGAVTQTVEVHETGTAQLQTMDSTVGSTISGQTLLQLPTQQRSATSLLLYQPASMPQQSLSQARPAAARSPAPPAIRIRSPSTAATTPTPPRPTPTTTPASAARPRAPSPPRWRACRSSRSPPTTPTPASAAPTAATSCS